MADFIQDGFIDRRNNILRGFTNLDNVEVNNDLSKGKSYPIGTIHNGYKKVKEGVWKKVGTSHPDSNQNQKTKQEHLQEASKHKEDTWLHQNHKEKASKLDDKDYSDTDVIGEKDEVTDEQRATIQSRMKAKLRERDEDYKNQKLSKGEELLDVNPFMIEDDILIKGEEFNPFSEYITDLSDNLEKGGKALPIGTKKMYGGKQYEKTAKGWRLSKKSSEGEKKQETSSNSYGSDMSDYELEDRLTFHQKKEKEAKSEGKPYKNHSMVRDLEKEWSKRNQQKASQSTRTPDGEFVQTDKKSGKSKQTLLMNFESELNDAMEKDGVVNASQGKLSQAIIDKYMDMDTDLFDSDDLEEIIDKAEDLAHGKQAGKAYKNKNK